MVKTIIKGLLLTFFSPRWDISCINVKKRRKTNEIFSHSQKVIIVFVHGWGSHHANYLVATPKYNGNLRPPFPPASQYKWKVYCMQQLLSKHCKHAKVKKWGVVTTGWNLDSRLAECEDDKKKWTLFLLQLNELYKFHVHHIF